MVSQNYIAWGVQLNQDVVGRFALPEGKIDHSVNAELLNFIQFLCSQMLSQLHREPRGQVLLVFNVISRVNTYTRFNQQVLLSVRARKL